MGIVIKREWWIFISGQLSGAACALIAVAFIAENIGVGGLALTLYGASYLIDPRNPHSYTAHTK